MLASSSAFADEAGVSSSNTYVKITAYGPVEAIAKADHDFTIIPEPDADAPITVTVTATQATTNNPDLTLHWPPAGVDPESTDLRETSVSYRLTHAGEPDISGSIFMASVRVERVPHMLFTSAEYWTPIRFSILTSTQGSIAPENIKQLRVALHYHDGDENRHDRMMNALQDYVAPYKLHPDQRHPEGPEHLDAQGRSHFEVFIDPRKHYGRYVQPIPYQFGGFAGSEGSSELPLIIHGPHRTASAWFSVRLAVQPDEEGPVFITESSQDDPDCRIHGGLFDVSVYSLDIPHPDDVNPPGNAFLQGKKKSLHGMLRAGATDARPYFSRNPRVVAEMTINPEWHADGGKPAGDHAIGHAGSFPADGNAPATPFWDLDHQPEDEGHPMKPRYRFPWIPPSEPSDYFFRNVDVSRNAEWVDSGEGFKKVEAAISVESYRFRPNYPTFAIRAMESLTGAYFFVSYGGRDVDGLGPDGSETVRAMDLNQDSAQHLEVVFLEPRASYQIDVADSDKLESTLLAISFAGASGIASLAAAPPLSLVISLTGSAVAAHRSIVENPDGEAATVTVRRHLHRTFAFDLANAELPSLNAIAAQAGHVHEYNPTPQEVEEGPWEDRLTRATATEVGALVIGFVRINNAVRVRARANAVRREVGSRVAVKAPFPDPEGRPGGGALSMLVMLRAE